MVLVTQDGLSGVWLALGLERLCRVPLSLEQLARLSPLLDRNFYTSKSIELIIITIMLRILAYVGTGVGAAVDADVDETLGTLRTAEVTPLRIPSTLVP